MPKVPKLEDGKLNVGVPDLDQITSDISEFLKTQFNERKYYSHLLLELQESRQGLQENVTQYALRMETYLSQLLTEISLSTSKLKELPARTAAMEDLVLHHFLMGLLKTVFNPESRQGPQENVNQYALRMETYLSQLLTEISFSTSKLKELVGRTAAMVDLVLHHFVMGLQPRISNIVRCKSPKTLNEAINFAVSEERSVRPNSRSVPFQRALPNTPPRRPFNNNNSSLFCRYCKMNGHKISTCKKRECNNSKSPRVSKFLTSQFH
nr:uncharacterized protein LOC116774130 [Danaus plexippus plexippus]